MHFSRTSQYAQRPIECNFFCVWTYTKVGDPSGRLDRRNKTCIKKTEKYNKKDANPTLEPEKSAHRARIRQ